MALDNMQMNLLKTIADLENVPDGAFNIRLNGGLESRNNTENITIETKADKPGIDIYIKAGTKNERVDIRSLLMKPCYVYKTIKLPEVMDEFRKAKQHLAIVVDEYGGTLGVITMEDVLEKMVGEIWDETDTVETEVREIAEGEYEIDGDMPIGDFLEMMEISEDDFDYESETVGGWTVEMFGAFPKAGESFTYQNVKVTVLEMDGLRVSRVKAERFDPEEAGVKSEPDTDPTHMSKDITES